VGAYDLTTGAPINANFISGLNNDPEAVALLGNVLFVANFSSNTIGQYNATTGAAGNATG
jgi:hypothetical protein